MLLRGVLFGTPCEPIPTFESGPRIGVFRTPLWSKAQSETVSALEDTAARLGAAGARFSEISLPEEFASLAEAHTVINNYERALGMAHEWHNSRDLISTPLREIIEDGFATPHARYVTAVRLVEHCKSKLEQALSEVDIALTPCANGEAPKGLHYAGDPAFQATWTLLHTPAVSLPTHRGPTGLPVGIQLVGRRYNDELLLAVAQWAWDRLR